jgi:hypothetical protein
MIIIYGIATSFENVSCHQLMISVNLLDVYVVYSIDMDLNIELVNFVIGYSIHYSFEGIYLLIWKR